MVVVVGTYFPHKCYCRRNRLSNLLEHLICYRHSFKGCRYITIYYHCHHFTDKKTELESLENLPRVIQLDEVGRALYEGH